jgi:signal transduction histidine kinase
MINKLRRKFILIATASLALVIVVLIATSSIINYRQMDQKANELLQMITENEGEFPTTAIEKKEPREDESYQRITEETPFQTRYFTIWTDVTYAVTKTDVSHVAAVTTQQASIYVNEILQEDQNIGYHGIYKYMVTEKPYGYIIVFIDERINIETFQSTLLTSCLIGAACLLVVFLLVSVFSKRVVRPVAESFEKQKQFITDASHEIKTPLAIISANTDVLELSAGKNEWTQSIRNQTKRLDHLAKDLLTLSKLEEGSMSLMFSEFSISKAVWESAVDFEPLAELKNKSFTYTIQPDLSLYGQESAVRQLVSLLLDNAIKYSDDEGNIKLSLSSVGKRCKIKVCNTVSRMPCEDLNRLFERFYRADASRSRNSGGYGIGLSIVKAIAISHKGKVTVQKQGENMICFTVIL